jgi:hypothetical protein
MSCSMKRGSRCWATSRVLIGLALSSPEASGARLREALA